jgi:hypothetical protein
MPMESLPAKLAPLSQEGINHVLDIAVTNAEIGDFVSALQDDPKGAIRRLFRLSGVQRTELMLMSDEAVAEIVRPAIELLERGAEARNSQLTLLQVTSPEDNSSWRCPRRAILIIERFDELPHQVVDPQFDGPPMPPYRQ